MPPSRRRARRREGDVALGRVPAGALHRRPQDDRVVVALLRRRRRRTRWRRPPRRRRRSFAVDLSLTHALLPPPRRRRCPYAAPPPPLAIHSTYTNYVAPETPAGCRDACPLPICVRRSAVQCTAVQIRARNQVNACMCGGDIRISYSVLRSSHAHSDQFAWIVTSDGHVHPSTGRSPTRSFGSLPARRRQRRGARPSPRRRGCAVPNFLNSPLTN